MSARLTRLVATTFSLFLLACSLNAKVTILTGGKAEWKEKARTFAFYRITDSLRFVDDDSTQTATLYCYYSRIDPSLAGFDSATFTKNAIRIKLKSFHGAGTYKLTTTTASWLGPGATGACILIDIDSGEVVLNEYDPIRKVVSGTFKFSVTCTDAGSWQIYDGQFGTYRVRIFDPYPDLLDGNGSLKNDIEAIAKLNSDRIGASADSVTRLVVVAWVGEALLFSLDSEATGLDNGTLAALGAPRGSLHSIRVEPRVTSAGDSLVVCVYTVPNGMNGGLNRSRETRLRIVKAADTTRLIRSQAIQLYRPGVVLVHGMWSRPAVWDEGGFASSLTSNGFDIFKADYSYDNASTFDPASNTNSGIIAVRQAILQALKNFRQRSIAASRVDVVAHSLGGLMTRAFIQRGKYRNPDNYNLGYIRRLITLGTPHLGSPLGPLLWDNRALKVLLRVPLKATVAVEEVLRLVGKPIGTVHRDFAYSPVMSQAFQNLNETEVLSHAVIARWPNAGSRDHFVFSVMLAVLFSKTHDEVFDNEVNDLLVTESSQCGHLIPGTSYVSQFSGVLHSAILPKFASSTPSETTLPAIQSEVIRLLESKDDAGYFASTFPKPVTDRHDDHDSYSTIVQPSFTEPSGIGTIAIVSPAPGSLFKHLDTVRVVVEARDGASPTGIIMMVQGIGLDTIAPAVPSSASFVIPADGPVGPINIVVLARDASGDLLGDTTSLSIASAEPLSRLVVQPESIELDDQVDRAKIEVLGKYVSGTDTITRDLSDGASGTTYAMLHGASVAYVDADGLVHGVTIGTDTVVVRHDAKVGYLPVTVSGIASSDVEENVVVNRPLKKSDELFVSPNPVTGIATVRYDLSESGRAKLDVVDMLGRVVRRENDVLSQRGIYTRTLDLSGLESGVYLCRLQTGNTIVSVLLRLVK